MKYLKKCNVAVIGGGASGMMAAITAARMGATVVLAEHTGRVGSKILSTGNGKCNYTNMFMDKSCFQNEDADYVMEIIKQFDEKEVIRFFKELGVYPKNKNGYIYPHSETAASVQDALNNALLQYGVEVMLDTCIQDITLKASEIKTNTIKKSTKNFETDEYTYILKTSCGNIAADRIILATGSKAFPKSGSDGSGYELAKLFGHRINKPLPALVQLKSDFKYCRVCAGVRSTGCVEVYADKKMLAADTGEIQYTDYGISGIPVFQISRHAVCAMEKKQNVWAVIDMLPDFSFEELTEDYYNRIASAGNKTFAQFYEGILNIKLVGAVAKSINIDPAFPAAKLRKDDFFKFMQTIKCVRFNITGSKDCDSAQVCQGGIRIQDLKDTLESLKVSGLYFAGEIIDVDGKCGGYNLQWAWSSGHVAAVNAVNDLKKRRHNG